MTKPLPAGTDVTENLLQGLIAECGAMIREQVRPAFGATGNLHERNALVCAVVDLAQPAAKVADTVARLRGQAAPGLRQRITVERIQRLSTPEGEGG